ncbi:hypothetical protein [Cohnella massiliensis]|uniref:hypothetical protein n=1 Tax=Cohnella massiliensis TaxID=1816691 RepID=UPI0009BA12F6|nr:hypothetical protein [Cohnella massiliensis]
MAVVRNLMIRIGADYSAAKKGMDGATRELSRFRKDTERSTDAISGKKGLGGLRDSLRDAGASVTASLSEIRGAKGLGGVVSGLAALRPAAGIASSSLKGFGTAASGAAGMVGGLGIGLGVLTAALGVATYGIYSASQEAVRFEANLGRLNMQLKGSSREFMTWARGMGLAKSTAADMGATYSTLLSSFISNNDELTKQTKEIVQATRVVASATGRTIEDTTERIRSGLLGNTEAIEDLGVFVNISMIESTNAFKKFANGKHWDQLDFRVQQQIRLAAILEQSYARYGNQLQNNVMTKQTLLVEQLKDIKLNLSQAFLPIWEAVLPALTALAENIAYVTEQFARFTYWVFRKDYDELTQGMAKGVNEQTQAVQEQSKAYDGLAGSAKKARGELASFDQFNLLGDSSGGGDSGNSGSGGGMPGPDNPPPPGGDGGWEWGGIQPFPPFLNKKWRIEFDPPNPPDAGMGAVATAVVNTINGLIKEVKTRFSQMWQELNGMTRTGLAGDLASWGSFAGNLSGVVLPGLTGSLASQWSSMWANLQAQTQAGYAGQTTAFNGMTAGIRSGLATSAAGNAQEWSKMWQSLNAQTQAGYTTQAATWSQLWQNIRTQNTAGQTATVTGWKAMLASMLADMLAFRTSNASAWSSVVTSVRSPLTPLAELKSAWSSTMADMRTTFSTSQSVFVAGFASIALAIRSLKSPLAEVKADWNSGLSSMYATASATMTGIITLINNVSTAWNNLKTTISGVAASTAKTLGEAGSTFAENVKGVFSKETFDGVIDTIRGEANKTQNQVALDIMGLLAGGGVVAGAGKAAASSGWMQKLLQSLKGAGISVPAFATGAIVYGPTLAMVGDNKGAATNPEIIAPLSDLENIMSGADNPETLAVLRQIYQVLSSGRNVNVIITEDQVGRAATNYINNEYRRGNDPLPSL